MPAVVVIVMVVIVVVVAGVVVILAVSLELTGLWRRESGHCRGCQGEREGYHSY